MKGLVDEIIIVDTGSSDSSKDIAKDYEAKVYDFEWCDDFSKARNYSFSKATKDYILWLDADDYITKENLKKLIELKNTLSPDVDVVSIGYSLSRNAKGETTYSLRRNRIVKREMGFLWKGRIHEYLDVMGVTIHSEAFVNHDKDKEYTNRNLTIFKLMKENNEEFTDRDRFYYANELYYNGEYKEAIEEYQKFIENGKGWIEDLKTATVNIVQCYTFTNQDDKNAPWEIGEHFWTSRKIQKVAYYKNKIIENFVHGDCDYIFFVDSDLVLNPKSLQQLIKDDKEIVANIFWTKWQEGGQELPQVWQKDFYTLYDAHMLRNITVEQAHAEETMFLSKLRFPGVYKVGGLGACTLIKRAVLEKGVHFGDIYNLSFWGEDRSFCVRAVAYGFELFVDTYYPAFHIFREGETDKGKAVLDSYKN